MSQLRRHANVYGIAAAGFTWRMAGKRHGAIAAAMACGSIVQPDGPLYQNRAAKFDAYAEYYHLGLLCTIGDIWHFTQHSHVCLFGATVKRHQTK